MSPFRLDIKTQCVAPLEVLQQHATANSHYPRVIQMARHERRLAVVGSGPLVRYDLEELRAWDGDIWAINSAANWLTLAGVRCVFVTVDPQEFKYDIVADEALVATCCHPDFLKKLKNVRVFDVSETADDGIHGGCVTATRIPALALKLGYTDISFFGCEGSYEDQDHVDHHNGEAEELIVRAGERDYRIETGLLVQCTDLMKLISALPDVFKNRSGGLLKAMIENPDTWEIVAVSAAMKVHLIQMNGDSGLYDQPYEART